MIKEFLSIFNAFRYSFYNYFVSYIPSNILRQFYLRNILFVEIGKECFVHMGIFIGDNRIKIGNNTIIGRNCYLGGGNLFIGNNVSITAQTYIFCSTHVKDSLIFETVNSDVIINDYVWIGARAMILPNVTIGEGAILGANSTATRNIPAYTVFAGCPAKKVGTRRRNLKYKLKYFPYFQ